ncbi:MAG: type IV secretion system DNA-binding domain-containing protein, partial [Candidatus Magasanikbacteria bacterium]|nr:type IV secretion system DNA-binding domain-containing protein [Candidatus Magasanikbacteria bacterium]
MSQLTVKGESAHVASTEDICFFAQTNYRNQMRKFGIKTDDRRRHMYVIGKTGMGKTTMLENMVLHDIYSGHGVGIVDPHGDYAEKIIDYIPPKRVNDVVYFNPADLGYPIGFNILEVTSEGQKHLVAAGLMGIFKKIWPDVWSSRMEYILNNTLLALLDYPGSTLLGINRMLADKDYRRKVIHALTDPVVKAFWQTEFANYPDRYMTEAVAPIQNKIGQFLSASVIRNMVAQVKSTINVREIMDSGKIFIMNLSKGRIGEDNSRLLGGMLITELQLAAMERVDVPESQRRDFFLYVDEFQNFATPSFANILSEARKYRLSLIMAHQYVMQLDEVVADAVFGNVGTTVTFRVGGADAEVLEKEFTPAFLIEDIVNLPKYQIILKLMIDGVASQPFTAVTMPPIGSPTDSREKV